MCVFTSRRKLCGEKEIKEFCSRHIIYIYVYVYIYVWMRVYMSIVLGSMMFVFVGVTSAPSPIYSIYTYIYVCVRVYKWVWVYVYVVCIAEKKIQDTSIPSGQCPYIEFLKLPFRPHSLDHSTAVRLCACLLVTINHVILLFSYTHTDTPTHPHALDDIIVMIQ